jgi:hypothetical protein
MFEYVLLPPVAEQILGRRYADYAGGGSDWGELVRERGWERTVRQYVADRLDLAETLGHDMMYVCPNPLPPSEGSPQPQAELPDDPVERVRRRVEWAESAPSEPADDSFLVYRLLKEEMERRGMDLPILAPAYGHGVWTDTDLMQTMLLDPELAHRHYRATTKRMIPLVDRYIALGIDQIGVGGDFAGSRPLISPEAYRTFIMPEVHTLSRRIHEAGRWSVNASDGDLWSVLDDFLLGCEVDGYLEIDMSAGMDLRRLKAAYGDRITFYGNMDCGNILSFGTEDEVRRLTREIIEGGRGDGGHVFCCSNAITASVPLANYLAMVNEYRDTFGLPSIGCGVME